MAKKQRVPKWRKRISYMTKWIFKAVKWVFGGLNVYKFIQWAWPYIKQIWEWLESF